MDQVVTSIYNRGNGIPAVLLPNDLDQHPFPPPPIELTVTDPLPRAKVEAAIGHGHNNLAAHDLSLEVSISIVLAGAVVLVLADRYMRGQPFQPLFIVGVEAPFVVVYQKNTVARCRRGYLSRLE
jgi:hypothetical protein